MNTLTSTKSKELPAIRLLLILNTAVLLFHICIVARICPYDIAWGGRLKSDPEMYVLETISILVNLIFSFVLLLRGRYIKPILSRKVVHVLLWIFFLIYSLNTIGNLFSVTAFEKYFAILTCLFAVLIGVVLWGKK